MTPQTDPIHILIIGGTGAVGQALTRLAHARGMIITLTYHSNEADAQRLATTHDARIIQCDLTSAEQRASLTSALEGQPPHVIVNCAGLASAEQTLAQLNPEGINQMMLVNCTGPLDIIRQLAPAITINGGADVVFLSALDRAQSLPIPVGFAATQGAINASCMAMAHELAPQGWRLNVLALGLLESGLSHSLSDALHEAFITYSALKRPGTTEEVARAILWLSTQNSYMNGKIVSLNGGI